jgi:glycerate 2-kinase
VTLREQAERIWRAGVAAVDSATLVGNAIQCTESVIRICDDEFNIRRIDRILVVGAGKAGGGMAAGVEAALGNDLIREKVVGWINVPSDCVRPLQKIHLHAARPAGVNEPTEDGVVGSEQILELVSSMSDDDLCLVLISGGGSALLPAPAPGISLEDKLAVTRFLMRSGATIHELNTVRKRLSRIKGGGLLRTAPAGTMISLIISDVAGDPLDIIASGPTVCDPGTARDALKVLERFADRHDSRTGVPDSVWRFLDEQVADADDPRTSSSATTPIACRNHIIGNNQTALDAAAKRARALGFEVRSLGTNRQGIARDNGIELAERCLAARDEAFTKGICFLAGGEPVVKLVRTTRPRKGGRNQEVALAAGCRWGHEDIRRLIVLSGGTDGEDGPTDAAGAWFDSTIQQNVRDRHLNPEDSLAINDSYTFFDQVGGLLKTGPTHTNVMDLQVALVAGLEE